jgi:hypothetical protein
MKDEKEMEDGRWLEVQHIYGALLYLLSAKREEL